MLLIDTKKDTLIHRMM